MTEKTRMHRNLFVRQGLYLRTHMERSFDELVAHVKNTNGRVVVGLCGRVRFVWFVALVLKCRFQGCPGSGKSTMAARLQEALLGSVVVPLDGFHLSNKILEARRLRGEKGSLATFDLDGFAHLLRRIKDDSTRSIFFPVFHRDMEESIAAEGEVHPSDRIIIVEGIWLLHNPEIRSLLDLSVFVDVPQDERIERLVLRGMQLGKTREDSAAWAKGPDERNAKIIEETRQYAGFLIQNNNNMEI